MAKNLFIIILSLFLFGSCAHEPRTLITGYGDLDLTLTVNQDIKWQSQKNSLGFALPDVNDFILELVAEGGTVKSLGTYSEFKSGRKKVPVGKYTLRAYYGDLQGEGTGVVSYYGETVIGIFDSEHTAVTLDCGFYNAFCSREISDVSSLLKDISVRFKSEHGQYICMDSNGDKCVSLVPGNVAVEIALTDFNGRSVTIRPFAFNIHSAEFYNIKVVAAENSIKLSYDAETEANPFVVEIGEDLFSSRVPSVTPNKSAFGFVHGQFAERCIIKANAESGLKNLFLTILSSPRCSCAYSQEKDILSEYSEPEAKNAEIDLTDIISELGVVGKGVTEYTIVLQAVDIYGRVANDPCIISVVITPVILELEQPEPIDLEAESVDVKVRYNGTDFEKLVSFQSSNNDKDWVDVDLIESRISDGVCYATVSVDKNESRLLLRAVVDRKYSEKVRIHRIIPDFSVACGPENIWSSKADIYVSGDRVQSCMRFLKVLIKEDGGEWHPAVVEKNIEENRITVSTLMPSTKYHMAVSMDGKPVYNFDFVTESAIGLSNNSFEEDHIETINIKHINCGGKYSNIQSWAPVYNRSSIKVSEAKGWASVNAKTCSTYATNQNTWFQVPTTEIVEKGYDGVFAVRLQNAAWDINGIDPQKDTRTDKIYYSRNVPNIKNRSAGKVFLGSYQFNADGSEVYNEGVYFSSRPTAVSGYYRYIQDIHDSAETGLVHIQVLGFDGDKEVVIGEGRGKLNPSTSFTQFKIPVEYVIRNVKATKLKLMVSSSCYASYNQNEETLRIKTTDYPEKGISVGAELYVDLLNLLYE